MTIIALLEEAQARLWEARPKPLTAAALDRTEIRGIAAKVGLLACLEQCGAEISAGCWRRLSPAG